MHTIYCNRLNHEANIVDEYCQLETCFAPRLACNQCIKQFHGDHFTYTCPFSDLKKSPSFLQFYDLTSSLIQKLQQLQEQLKPTVEFLQKSQILLNDQLNPHDYSGYSRLVTILEFQTFDKINSKLNESITKLENEANIFQKLVSEQEQYLNEINYSRSSYNQGILLYQQDQIEDAFTHFKKIDRSFFQQVDLFLHGSDLMKSQDFQGAIKQYEDCLDIDKFFYPALVEKVKCLHKLKKYETALQELESILQYFSKNIYLIYEYALMLYQQGKSELSLQWIEKHLRQRQIGTKTQNSNQAHEQNNQGIWKILILKATILQSQGFQKRNDAIEAIDQALKLQINQIETLIIKTQMLTGFGDVNSAQMCLMEANQLDPQNLEIKIFKGLLLFNCQKEDEALKQFETLKLTYPNCSQVHENLGILLHRRKNYKEALKNFTQAQQLDSSKASTCYQIGNCYEWLDQIDQAENQYKRGLELDPTNFQILAALGKLLMNQQKFDSALKYVTQACDLNGQLSQDLQEVRFIKARLLLKLGKYSSSIDEFERLAINSQNQIELKLEHGQTLYHILGIGLYQSGQYELALKKFKEVLKLDPNHVIALNNKGLTLLRFGKNQEAIDDLNRAKSLEPANTTVQTNLLLIEKEIVYADYNCTQKEEPKIPEFIDVGQICIPQYPDYSKRNRTLFL